MSHHDTLSPSGPHQTAEDAGHFTRLWPTADGRPADAPLFLAAVSPFRVLALAVLWATSSPGRFVCGLAAVVALAAVAAVVL